MARTLEELNTNLSRLGDVIGDIKSDTDSILAKITELQQNPPSGMSPDQQALLDGAVSMTESLLGKATEIDNLVPKIQAPSDQGTTGGTEAQGGDTGATGSTGGVIDPNAPVAQPAGQEPGNPPVATGAEPLPDANAADQTVGNENPTT